MLNYPSDWEVKKLGECVTENLSYGINAPAIPYDRRKPAYIRITDITEDGKYDDVDKKSVAYSDYERYILHYGDIVIARTGASVGKSYCYNVRDGKLVYAGYLIKASIDCDKFDPRYIVAQLRTPRYWSWVISMSMRSGQPGINSQEYSSFLIPLPSLPEQQAIADTLTAFDTHITNLAALIDKKKAIRDGALDDLMSGRTRLKGFSGEWEVKKLGEIAYIQDGTHGTFTRVSLGKLLLSAKNVFDNHLLVTENESMVSEADYNKIIANGFPRIGDILLSCVGTIGRCCILNRNDVAFQRSVAFIRPYTVHNKYLMFLLQSIDAQKQLTSLVNASAQGGVYLNTLKQIKLRISCDVDEQIAIAGTLTALDDEITALEAEREKFIQIRDGAMNDLLTGKVRLKI